MAKKSKIAKEKKRQKLVEQYAELRKELKEKGDYRALSKLPRDSAPSNYVTRLLKFRQGYIKNLSKKSRRYEHRQLFSGH